MTSKQLKTEINKALDHMPDTVLTDVLEYLKKLKNSDQQKYADYQRIRRILEEDSNLLERLAK